jgi:acetoin utilization protein AcuC
MTYQLLQAYAAFDGLDSKVIAPTAADPKDLARCHTPEYIDAVRRLSEGNKQIQPWEYNFGPGDNPVFPAMYETEALKAGASLTAARMVALGQVDVAFSFAGGLHHAMAGHASGFCVFNDPAIAIHWLVEQGMRVVYVDIDAHHGDGVQAAFYDTDQVMTISLHESGHYLFPGTGTVQESGTKEGQGYSVNVPLLPHTNDEVYLWTFETVVPPLIADFAPDVLVTQLGVDAHYRDPLAHLALTTDGYTTLLRAFRNMGLPWVALGGGGYNVHTVARVWTLAYGIMSEQALSDQIPAAYRQKYGDRWLRDRQAPPVRQHDVEIAREEAARQVAALKKILGPERFR